MVLYEAMHALPYHAQTFLKRLFEGTADSHYLSYTLHGGTEFTLHTMELGQVPTRNLHDDIVKSRFEEGRGSLGNAVLQVEETIAQTELSSHESQWITRGLRS